MNTDSIRTGRTTLIKLQYRCESDLYFIQISHQKIKHTGFCSYDLKSQKELLNFKSKSRSLETEAPALHWSSVKGYEPVDYRELPTSSRHRAHVCPFTANSSPRFIGLSTAVLTWLRFTRGAPNTNSCWPRASQRGMLNPDRYFTPEKSKHGRSVKGLRLIAE